jgi:hypothetical protein
VVTSPDLPPPITPDVPAQPEPADLPVEPDQGASSAARAMRRMIPGVALATHLTARVPRQFMRVATYRWHTGRPALLF